MIIVIFVAVLSTGIYCLQTTGATVYRQLYLAHTSRLCSVLLAMAVLSTGIYCLQTTVSGTVSACLLSSSPFPLFLFSLPLSPPSFLPQDTSNVSMHQGQQSHGGDSHSQRSFTQPEKQGWMEPLPHRLQVLCTSQSHSQTPFHFLNIF